MTALPYSGNDRRDGVVGLSYALRQVAQLLLMCDRHDIGISIGSTQGPGPAGDRGQGTGDRGTGTGNREGHGVREPGVRVGGLRGDAAVDWNEPVIFVYDSYPGGIGFSEPLFGMHEALARPDARADCRMSRASPAVPPVSGPLGEVGPLAKTVSLAILDRLAGPL